MKDNVKLQIEFTHDEWVNLVEMSRGRKHATPAETINLLVLRQLKEFLEAKVVGMEQMRNEMLKSLNDALENHNAKNS